MRSSLLKEVTTKLLQIKLLAKIFFAKKLEKNTLFLVIGRTCCALL